MSVDFQQPDLNRPDNTQSPRTAVRGLSALRHGCRYLLAAVFLMAALSKITDLHGFQRRMVDDSRLPSTVGRVVAISLPWLELVCGLCLALGTAVREAALLLFFLLVLLFAYSLMHLKEPDCGCFFTQRKPTNDEMWWWPPLRNLLLSFCSLLLVVRSQQK